MNKAVMLFILLFFLIQPLPTAADESVGKVMLVVKSSGESVFQSDLFMASDQLFDSIINAEPLQTVTELPNLHHYLLFEDRGIIRIFVRDEFGKFYDVQRKEKVQFPSVTANKLNRYFNALHKKHFGKLVEWETIEGELPLYATFKVTDLETGLSFYAQRRAGSNHADVQPVTKKDTNIMKKIYNDKWSWNRRAVLIHCEDQIIAASMHGMPHGGGALSNGFPGHFCIHFKGSLTHSTRNEDLSHQVMVHKAGGSINQFVKSLPAEEIVQLYFIALNQNDADLFRLISHESNRAINLNNFEFAKLMKLHAPSTEEPFEFEIEAEFKIKEKGKPETNDTFRFRLIRDSLMGGWKLQDTPLDF
ncbi:hypothetical protein [Salipaludibacillus aurantiacus]|uniref:Uncharacterized protein n=1 Tax=Salipaludibacillus aurantiacus TaxID=1601833 RepID=A0A1H9VZA2_9BACI|nr:hypothetical protein [Salipaludibacillus aurantiacus]SES26878.1 hypothetical protein SAMN05518684_11380 [Salipaludibacillus aurantiacus]